MCQKDYPNCGDTLSISSKLGYAPYFNTTQARWGSTDYWVEVTTNRLKSWGFNSIGGWSAKVVEGKNGIYYAHLLDMLTTWQNHFNLPDIFGTDFQQRSLQIAQKECLTRANDEMLLGYQTDNELPWDKDFIAQYLTNQSNSTPDGYIATISFLESTYKVIGNLNKAWNINAGSFSDVVNHLKDPTLNKTQYQMDLSDFLFIVATKYFEVATQAIRKYDPNHLILGCRADVLPDPVIKAHIPYVDVIDLHSYADKPPIEFINHIWNLTHKPIMLGEFSFTAVDSNMPNTVGARAGNPFATQSQRTAAYLGYVKPLLSLPFVVGYHWWQWADEPSSGRWWDGEDSNYGLVHIDDEAYELLTDAMTTANAQANTWHKGG
jgi:hypothetical protein